MTLAFYSKLIDPYSGICLLNKELHLVSTWFKANKLSLNVNKTNFMIFQNKHSTYKDLNITIDGTIVKQVDTVKFLGLLIDSHLTWKPHIDHLCSKISKIIGVLYKIKHFVPPSVLKI